jgi:DNA-directed RNA polymerase subunit RPC12/RpoP
MMQEKVIFKCGGCGARLRISINYRGRSVRCPNCKSIVYVREKAKQTVDVKPSKTRVLKTPTILKREINTAVIVVPVGIVIILAASLSYFFIFRSVNENKTQTVTKPEKLEKVLEKFKRAWETGAAEKIVEFYKIDQTEKEKLKKELSAVFDMYFIKIGQMKIGDARRGAHVEFEMKFVPKVKEAEPQKFTKKTRWVLKDSQWLCLEPVSP